jgi:hypothetical protein
MQTGKDLLGFLKRLSPLVPAVLLAAFPVVSLFEHNQTELALDVLWVPLAISVAAGAALFAVFVVVLKRSAKAGVLASLLVVAFFYYGTLYTLVSGWGLSKGLFIALWAALFVLGVFGVVRTDLALNRLALVLGVFATVQIFGPAAKIVAYQGNHPGVRPTDARLWTNPLPKPAPPAGAHLPDIYVLIPDDYERSDVLKQYFHYDNSHFLHQLKKRGFVVSDQARSPYSDSESNIAAALNMDYLSGLARIVGKKSQDVRPVKTLIEDNRAARLLKPLGYRYVHLDTDEVTFAAGNPRISPTATPDSFTNLWLQNSVLRSIGGTFGFNDAAGSERFRTAIRSTFSDLAAVPRDAGPKFVLFHTLLPHDPYIYGAKGRRATFPDKSEDALGSKLGMKYYVRQSRFVETKLLDSVDAIQARSKAPPVILIQSDEGFSANPENFGETAMKNIRVKGLAAFYIPGVRGARAPQPPNTVNSLRFVFNRYLGTHYPLLRSASYPELDLPYQFKEMRVK